MGTMLDLGREDFPRFLLALSRVTGVVMLAPVFGSRVPPASLKALLALALAAVFWPLVGKGTPAPADGPGLLWAAATELGLGLLIGFAAASVFAGIQFAGSLVDQELGIQQASLLDPMSGEQVSVIGQYKLFLATAVYLLIDGHHFLIDAMAHSFRTVPLTGLALGPGAGELLTTGLLRDLFRMGVEIAAPALATLFLVTIAMAFMARAVPEMNLFVLGFPVRLAAGFLVLAAGTGLLSGMLRSRLLVQSGSLRRLVELLGG